MPSFGRPLLSHWYLAPESVYLNHGTVGATPRVVIEAQQAWQRRIESAPARYVIHETIRTAPDDPSDGRPRPRLRQAADAVAAFLGARGEDLVFVDNASAGMNAVIRSLRLAPGDEILLLDVAYGAVKLAAGFAAEQAGARLVTAVIPFPATGEDAPARCIEAVEHAITPRTRLAILDHVASDTALLLPVAAMAAACRARGVPVLVDGAHAPGAIALDIPSLGVDWYVGNLHKWAFAPRACGILWVAPGRREGLHPAVISWGLGNGLSQEFDWTGTRDPSGFLSAPVALDFMRDTLGVDAMRAWNHGLVWRMAHEIGERWGQPFATPASMVGTMASIALPQRLQALGPEAAPALKDWLLRERDIEAQILAVRERLWWRLAAQVYNEASDFERATQAIEAWRP